MMTLSLLKALVKGSFQREPGSFLLRPLKKKGKLMRKNSRDRLTDYRLRNWWEITNSDNEKSFYFYYHHMSAATYFTLRRREKANFFSTLLCYSFLHLSLVGAKNVIFRSTVDSA